MKKHRGGEKVKGGTYWSINTWEFVPIPEGGSVLPGGVERGYLRAPIALALVAGPLMGLGYVLFLPFMGIAALAVFLGQRLGRALGGLGRHLARTAVPNWVPQVAQLTGQGLKREKPQKKEAQRKGSGEAGAEDILGSLERELETRRRQQSRPDEKAGE